jgi:hypothetical protein
MNQIIRFLYIMQCPVIICNIVSETGLCSMPLCAIYEARHYNVICSSHEMRRPVGT